MGTALILPDGENSGGGWWRLRGLVMCLVPTNGALTHGYGAEFCSVCFTTTQSEVLVAGPMAVG